MEALVPFQGIYRVLGVVFKRLGLKDLGIRVQC